MDSNLRMEQIENHDEEQIEQQKQINFLKDKEQEILQSIDLSEFKLKDSSSIEYDQNMNGIDIDTTFVTKPLQTFKGNYYDADNQIQQEPEEQIVDLEQIKIKFTSKRVYMNLQKLRVIQKDIRNQLKYMKDIGTKFQNTASLSRKLRERQENAFFEDSEEIMFQEPDLLEMRLDIAVKEAEVAVKKAKEIVALANRNRGLLNDNTDMLIIDSESMAPTFDNEDDIIDEDKQLFIDRQIERIRYRSLRQAPQEGETFEENIPQQHRPQEPEEPPQLPTRNTNRRNATGNRTRRRRNRSRRSQESFSCSQFIGLDWCMSCTKGMGEYFKFILSWKYQAAILCFLSVFLLSQLFELAQKYDEIQEIYQRHDKIVLNQIKMYLDSMTHHDDQDFHQQQNMGLQVPHYQFQRLKQNSFDDLTLLEMYFNSMVITWPFYFTSLMFFFHLVFMIHCSCLNYFVDWKQKEKVLTSIDKSILQCNWLIEENFWYVLAWYQFIDGQYIFPTSFEFTFYLMHFWLQSNLQATKSVCQEFVKEVLEPEIQQAQLQIVNLDDKQQRQTHEALKLRIIKVAVLLRLLKWAVYISGAIVLACLIRWEITKELITHLVLLMFTVVINFLETRMCEHQIEVSIQENKFQGIPESPLTALYFHIMDRDLNELPLVPKQDLDQFKLASIDLDFKMFTAQVLIRLVHFVALLYVRGMNFNLFDVLLLGKATWNSISKMLADLIQYAEFKQFINNIQENLELKQFSQVDQEICPICQDYMLTGRKLPCNHVFHQFCLIKLLQNGGDKCPMCRQDIIYPNEEEHPEEGNAEEVENIEELWVAGEELSEEERIRILEQAMEVMED